LTHPGGHFIPFLSVSVAAREHGIAAHSASKAWNLAGLKCAQFVTADDRTSQLIGTLPEEVYYRASLFGRIASTAAYADGADWLDGVLRAISDNARLLESLLAEHLPTVRYRVPSASYLAWLDFSALGWGDDPSKRILDDARVALVRGLDFGRQGAGFARLNVACSPDVLTDAIERIARIV
jgi:cystathionine beta-lyase